MNCPTIERLYAYLEGELPPDEARVFEDHAAACPPCRALVDDRRAFLEAAASLPPLPVADDFAASVLARLETVPAPAQKRMTLGAWLAAAAAGFVAFIATLAVAAFATGQNLGLLLARLQHAALGYFQAAATAVVHIIKYVSLFLKVAGEFASTFIEIVKRASAFVTPPVQAACAGTAVVVLVMLTVLWRRRAFPMENHHEK